jgi:hypothetical protein
MVYDQNCHNCPTLSTNAKKMQRTGLSTTSFRGDVISTKNIGIGNVISTTRNSSTELSTTSFRALD